MEEEIERLQSIIEEMQGNKENGNERAIAEKRLAETDENSNTQGLLRVINANNISDGDWAMSETRTHITRETENCKGKGKLPHEDRERNNKGRHPGKLTERESGCGNRKKEDGENGT